VSGGLLAWRKCLFGRRESGETGQKSEEHAYGVVAGSTKSASLPMMARAQRTEAVVFVTESIAPGELLVRLGFALSNYKTFVRDGTRKTGDVPHRIGGGPGAETYRYLMTASLLPFRFLLRRPE
jgi:hypothetical protein